MSSEWLEGDGTVCSQVRRSASSNQADKTEDANGHKNARGSEEGCGLTYVGNMAYTDIWPSSAGQAIMVYGIGTVLIPLKLAYEAAGLPVP